MWRRMRKESMSNVNDKEKAGKKTSWKLFVLQGCQISKQLSRVELSRTLLLRICSCCRFSKEHRNMTLALLMNDLSEQTENPSWVSLQQTCTEHHLCKSVLCSRDIEFITLLNQRWNRGGNARWRRRDYAISGRKFEKQSNRNIKAQITSNWLWGVSRKTRW